MTTKSNHFFSGWDIGGAHLKIARADAQGQLIAVHQFPCPLWQGLDKLRESVGLALQQLDNLSDIHAVTMTGELVDCFANRRHGVEMITQCISELLPVQNIHLFAGQTNWYAPAHATTHWQAIASMNWLASAGLAASQFQSALFIDIGSTTCDIIPIKDHQPQPAGITDHQRQQSRELTYTGAIRTPLIALAQQAPFNGHCVTLAAEWFATAADCWCLLDQLDPQSIQDRSADNQPWDTKHCQQRLARMLGLDADDANNEQWQLLARWFAEKQVQVITDSCLQVLSAHPSISANTPVIGAGVGRFIARMCAVRLQRSYIDFEDLQGISSMPTAAEHAPAAALALLAYQQFT